MAGFSPAAAPPDSGQYAAEEKQSADGLEILLAIRTTSAFADKNHGRRIKDYTNSSPIHHQLLIGSTRHNNNQKVRLVFY